MKVIVLAGGLGTRLSEQTMTKPKPMVEIGEYPILWHVMQIYATHGFTNFVVACGYKGEVIKEYFGEMRSRQADFTVDLGNGHLEVHAARCPAWRVTLVDTGLATTTGGRIKRLQPLIGNEPFMVTYGDGLGDIDVGALLEFHRRHGKLATVTAVRPAARFGVLRIERDEVADFSEKPRSGTGWVNGGFFVFEPGALEYLSGHDVPLEGAPLERLSRDRQLMAYRHPGYWQPMDTLRDQLMLDKQWKEGNAPWKIWH